MKPSFRVCLRLSSSFFSTKETRESSLAWSHIDKTLHNNRQSAIRYCIRQKHVKNQKTRHPSDHDALLRHFPFFFFSSFVRHFFTPLYTIHITASIHTIVFQLLFGLRKEKGLGNAVQPFRGLFMPSVIRFLFPEFARARFRLAQMPPNFRTLLAIFIAIEPVSSEHSMYSYLYKPIQI